MGGKQSTSTPPRIRTLSTGAQASSSADLTTAGMGSSSSAGTSAAATRARARSLGNFPSGSPSLNIPTSNGGPHAVALHDSDSSNSDDHDGAALRPMMHSLPLHLFALQTRLGHLPGIKCPVCSKMVQPEEIECHLVICLTKPRISYNEDVLTDDKGECVICFEDLLQGNTIARLPCLCVYHKSCIDKWFEVNRSCPEHPVD